MFGTYRLVLALAVVCQHLLCVPIIGHHAVHGFFVLSGFLMTLVMQESYGYSRTGFRAFCINRFLRLYPVYWFLLILSLGIVSAFGESNAAQYREFIGIPTSIGTWLQNLSMIYLAPFPGHVSPRISPPTWALTLELCFYFLIAVGISRTRVLSNLWLAASIVFTAFTFLLDLPHDYRYGFILSASLPFSLGSFLYHHRESITSNLYRLPRCFSLVGLVAASILNVVFCIGTRLVEGWGFIEEIGFFINLVIQFLLIARLTTEKWPGVSMEVDKRLGDFSYPIYIGHWQVAFATSMLLFGAPVRARNWESFVIFTVSMLPLLVVSWVGIHFIDGYTNRIRAKIKKRVNQDGRAPKRHLQSKQSQITLQPDPA